MCVFTAGSGQSVVRGERKGRLVEEEGGGHLPLSSLTSPPTWGREEGREGRGGRGGREGGRGGGGGGGGGRAGGREGEREGGRCIVSVTKVGMAYRTDCEPFADCACMHGLGSRPSPLCGM